MNAERYTDRAKGFIQSARPLKRVIQRYVQDPLAEMILAGNVRDDTTVKISAGKDGIVFNGKRPATVDEDDLELA